MKLTIALIYRTWLLSLRWTIGLIFFISLMRQLDGVRAQVAQLVEHSTENAGVGCSIQPLGTIPP